MPVLSLVRPVLSSSNSVNKRSISGGTLCGTSYRSLSPAPMIACMASYNDACEGIVREDRRPRWRRPVIVTFPTLGLLNRQPPISVPRNPYWLLFESEAILPTNSARSTARAASAPLNSCGQVPKIFGSCGDGCCIGGGLLGFGAELRSERIYRARARQPDAKRQTRADQRGDLPAGHRSRNESADAGCGQDAGYPASREPWLQSEHSAEVRPHGSSFLALRNRKSAPRAAARCQAPRLERGARVRRQWHLRRQRSQGQRSLKNLIQVLGELHAKCVDLYLHQAGARHVHALRPGDVPDDGASLPSSSGP